jgi:hypothetical protein
MPTVTASIFHSGTTSNDYTLVIYLTNNTEIFHIEDFIYCNGVEIASGCNTFEENGTLSVEFTCVGKPTATVNVYTQPCGNTGDLCGTVIATTPDVGGPLPVVVSGFFLQRNSKNVIATWQTQQEINSDRFEVERSFDNKLFQTVGTVASHVNSNAINNYSYTINTDTRNTSFFRIKMIDKDGSVSFTSIKSVKGNNVKADFIIFPNPSFGNAKITITDLSEPTNVQVLDNSGRMIKAIALVNSNIVEIGNLQKGTYIVRIIGKISNEIIARKLTVID